MKKKTCTKKSKQEKGSTKEESNKEKICVKKESGTKSYEIQGCLQ